MATIIIGSKFVNNMQLSTEPNATVHRGLFNAKTKTMAWDIYGASNRLLFHVKASFDPPSYLVEK